MFNKTSSIARLGCLMNANHLTLQASSFWKKSCVLVQEAPILHKGNECTSCSVALWQVMQDSKVYNQSQNVIPCSDKDNVLYSFFFFFL